MSRTAELDALTEAQLRERGSLKWTGVDRDTIGAWVAEMDFGTAPEIEAAVRAAAGSGSLGYLPPGPRAELATACAEFQRQRYGWAVPPEHVFAVPDVVTALELVLRHFSRPGSPLVVPTPAYMPFLSVPPLHGRQVIEVPMARDSARGRFELDLAGLDRAFRAGGHLLVLCNPANPTGRVLSAGELAAVTELVDRHGGRVFADEIHAPLVYPGHRHLPYAASSDTAAGHTVTATSASKAWNLPGLKCGQVIAGNPADAATWQQVGSQASGMPSVLGVAAAIAAYRAGGPWLAEVLAYLDRNRRALGELLAGQLPQVGYHPPEGTYLAWLDCRPLRPGGDLTGDPGGDLAGDPAGYFHRHAGVALTGGPECGGAGHGHVRLNFATPLPVLRRAVARMAGATTLEVPNR